AHLEVDEAKGAVEVVYPPISVLAEPPVAWVDANVKRKGTEDISKAYLNFLYTDEGQEIIAKHYFRPINKTVFAQHAATFPEIKQFPVTAVARSWEDAYDKYFGDGKIFDSFYKPKK